MKKKFCRGFLALTFTLLCLKIPAQQALKIGETLPESFWTTPLQVVNHPEKTITLDKDRGKLILLDFWNTWCSGCLLGFPKMEALQKEFGDRMKILAATSQDRATLEKFFATKNGQRFKNIVSVTGEPRLKQYFPHEGVPFIVWLKDGKLLNTTDGDQVTKEAIAAVMTGKNDVLQTVIHHKGEGPLMISDNLQLERDFLLSGYTFFGRGRLRAMGFGTNFHRNGNEVYGRQFYNLRLVEIYSAIADEIFRNQSQVFKPNRMISELQDDALFINKDKNHQYIYTYDFILPQNRALNLYPAMLQTLNFYAPVTGTIEKRMQSCLVLSKAGKTERLLATGGPLEFNLRPAGGFIKNANMYDFVNFINGLPDMQLPILDETGIIGKVSLQLGDISTLPSLKKELAKHGLQLTEATKEIDMLIMRDKEQAPGAGSLTNQKK